MAKGIDKPSISVTSIMFSPFQISILFLPPSTLSTSFKEIQTPFVIPCPWDTKLKLSLPRFNLLSNSPPPTSSWPPPTTRLLIEWDLLLLWSVDKCHSLHIQEPNRSQKPLQIWRFEFLNLRKRRLRRLSLELGYVLALVRDEGLYEGEMDKGKGRG